MFDKFLSTVCQTTNGRIRNKDFLLGDLIDNNKVLLIPINDGWQIRFIEELVPSEGCSHCSESNLFLFSSLFWGQKVNCLEISK